MIAAVPMSRSRSFMNIRGVIATGLVLVFAVITTSRQSTGGVVKLDKPTTKPVADTAVFAASNAGSMSDVFPGLQKLLDGTVHDLSAKKKFDVVLFNAAGQTRSSDAPVTADAAGKEAAKKFIDAASASGDGDPAKAITAIMDLHPASVTLILDAVPDPDAFTKAIDAADPKHKVSLIVIFLTDKETKETKAGIAALKKAASVRHGAVSVLKRSALAG
jgi:hypothetical protein